MAPVRIAFTALTAAMAVARHPMVRAGIRAVAEDPRAREAAVSAVRNTAYAAGVAARRVVSLARKTGK